MVKIVTKIPDSNKELDLQLKQDQWTPMKEPTNIISAMLFSIPFLLIIGWISIAIVNIFSPISLSEFGIKDGTFTFSIDLIFIIGLFMLLVLHECIHLVLVPNFTKSKKTYMGITFFGGFVATEEEIKKGRFILITIAPYFIISIILPIILGVFGLLTTGLKFLIILNAMASSVDILTLFLVLTQVPNKATLVSNGQKTYWKVK